MQAAQDSMHQSYINSIREVEVYKNGDTNYELPAGYKHVYANGNGDFVMTDNALFKPNVALAGPSNWASVAAER